jgi:hypothetical protein
MLWRACNMLVGLGVVIYVCAGTLVAAGKADDIINDRFVLQGVSAEQPRRADGGFVWDHRGPRDDPEWAWFFNRHDWFGPLLDAWKATGDDHYVEFLLAALDDWIAQHPAPRGFTISSSWRPLEAARRILGTWPRVYRELQHHPLFTPERQQRFREKVRDHGLHLRSQHVHFGNHLVTEVLALTKIALWFPQFPESAAWLDYGLATLAKAYDGQVYPDGAQKELSTHYQRVVALNFQMLQNMLREHGKAELADQWQGRVRALWLYLAGVIKPDGSNPVNNDSDFEDVTALLTAHAPDLLERTNAPASVIFPWAGQAVLRSRTDGGDVLWAWFDAGPRGIDHDHHDPLQFSLSVGTANFLVDNGRYTYAPGPFRRYFSGPEAHNTVLLNGAAATPGPRWVNQPATLLKAAHIDHPQYSVVSGADRFTAAGNPRAADWRRTVIHLKGVGFIVADFLLQFSRGELRTLWHWDAAVGANGNIEADKFVVSNGDKDLSVRLLTTGGSVQMEHVIGRVEPRPQGWTSRFFNQRHPALATEVSQRISGVTLNVWIFEYGSREQIAVHLIDNDSMRIEYANEVPLFWHAAEPLQLQEVER